MKRLWRGMLPVLLAAGLLSVLPLRVSAAPRICAAQVGYLPSRSYPEVAAEFARMRRMGLDTVILRVFQRPGDRPYLFAQPQAPEGVYFATEAAPVVDDVLGSMTTLAHAAGLKVFAWMTTLSTPLAGHEDWCGRRYDPAEDRVVPCETLDPFRLDVRRHLAMLFRDLARYDIDGVLLQDDLVLRQTEGFSCAALGACLRDTGRIPSPARLFPEVRRDAEGRTRITRLGDPFYPWARWKNEALLQLGVEMREAARRVRPGLPFALNLPYEVLAAPQNGLAWFSQDFSRALGSGFDYVAVMAYHRQMAAELETSVDQAVDGVGRMVATGVHGMRDPAALLVKLQTRDFVSSRDITATELERLLRVTEGVAPVSLAFFPYSASLAVSPENLAQQRIEEEQ